MARVSWTASARTTLRASLAAAALAAHAPAQAVHIVAGDGSGDFLQLKDAVAAAAQGDVILVRPHTERYAAVTIAGKALAIVGEGAERPQVQDVRVTGLPVGRDVVLRNLDLLGRNVPFVVIFETQHPGLELVSNAGCTWVEDLLAAGSPGVAQLGGFESGIAGLVVEDSDRVIVVDSRLEGGQGFWSVGGTSRPGGAGGELGQSQVALYGTTLLGGTGGMGVLGWPETGGIGLDSSTSTVFASGSSLTGGDTGDEALVATAEPTASGLLARDGSVVSHLATSIAAGGGPAAPGTPVSIAGGSTVVDLDDVHRAVELPAVVREGELASLHYAGQPGDLVLLRLATSCDWSPMLSLKGVLHLGEPAVEMLLGATGPSGTLRLTFHAPRLPLGVEALSVRAQPVVQTAAGALRLGAPSHGVLVDASVPAP